MVFQISKNLSEGKNIFNRPSILQSHSEISVKHNPIRYAKILLLFSIIFLSIFLSSCVTEKALFREEETLNYSLFPYPSARFAVLSDLHLYSLTLGEEGEEFLLYLEKDRKHLRESEALLKAAVNLLLEEKPEFLLISGDLTKDGELANHRLAVEYLDILRQAGIQVFVVPGNHDIANPMAYSFGPEGSRRVESVTPEEFALLYQDFGYAAALHRDPSSLSYVSEPVEGLWLLALDSCLYSQNDPEGKPVTEGGFSKKQIAWITKVLSLSQREGKAVIAMMHHGTVEHHEAQEKHFGEYLIEGWREFSRLLAFHNVRVVFTGHYHAQDITKAVFNGTDRFILDIETGSLVTYPCPVRFVEFSSPWTLNIASRVIDSIDYPLPPGVTFREYSREYLESRISGIAVDTLRKLKMKDREIGKLVPQITAAFVAHYSGDENFQGTEMLSRRNLSLLGHLVVADRKDLVYGLWKDLPPADNNLTINLQTGEEK